MAQEYSFKITQRENGSFKVEPSANFLVANDIQKPLISPYGVEESNYDDVKKHHINLVVDDLVSEIKQKEKALLKAVEECTAFKEKYDLENLDYKPILKERDGKCFIRVGFNKYTELTKVVGNKVSKLKPENIKADSKIYGVWSVGVYCMNGSYGFFLTTRAATVKLGNKEPEKKRSIIDLIHEQMGCKKVRIQEYKSSE
jgi:tRNA U34 5-carboxymethylaminomethyl modifying enzyme MnmG/GidA